MGSKKRCYLKIIKFWPFFFKDKMKQLPYIPICLRITYAHFPFSHFAVLLYWCCSLIDAYFALCYASRRARSSRKPGQVGILTHREAKWIILILLEGSALHTVIERHAAPSLTLPRQRGKLHLRAFSCRVIPTLTSSAVLINKSTIVWLCVACA